MVKIKGRDRRPHTHDVRAAFGGGPTAKNVRGKGGKRPRGPRGGEDTAGVKAAPTGRFAADMRVCIGGYGPPSQQLRGDHPWHRTKYDSDEGEEGSTLRKMYNMEGELNAESREGQASSQSKMSRAAMRRLKKKGRKQNQGLSVDQAVDPVGGTSLSQPVQPGLEAGRLKPSPQIREQRQPSIKDEASTDPEQTDAEENVSNSSQGAHRTKGSSKELTRKESDRKTVQGRNKAINSEKYLERTLNAQNSNPAEITESGGVSRTKTTSSKCKNNTMEKQQRDSVLPAQGVENCYAQESLEGLVVEDLQIGGGSAPRAGEQVTLRYRGALSKASVQPRGWQASEAATTGVGGTPGGGCFGKGMLTFRIGQGKVIRGLEHGVMTMKEGGRRLLTVPPNLGYAGSRGGDKIPPWSTLYFHVELIRVGKRNREAEDSDSEISRQHGRRSEANIPLPSSFTRKKSKKR